MIGETCQECLDVIKKLQRGKEADAAALDRKLKMVDEVISIITAE